MTTKKNMVKQVLMSALTAGIFTFGFTACSDDEMIEGSMTPESEQEYNGPILEPYGLSFYDYNSGDDVQILNADTTQISVSKALADKLGIKSFVGHPMGIWQGPAQRAFLRRATKEKLEGDNYILNVTPSSIAEIMVGQKEEVKLSTEIYVNTDMQAVRSRAAADNIPEYAARYIDDENVIHPMAVTINPSDEAGLTRSAEDNNIYGTYLPEQLLGIDDPETRGFWSKAWNFIKGGAKKVAKFTVDAVEGTADWFKKKTEKFEEWVNKNTKYDINCKKVNNTLINIDTRLEKKIPIEINANDNDHGDTINVYVKAPVKFNLNYTLILRADGSLVQLPRLNEFEASMAGRFNFEPEVRVGFGGKLELPEDKQKLKIVDFESYTVTFTIGYVPFTVDICPNLFLKFEAEVGGQATMGVKYEFDSWFRAGLQYHGRFGGISEGRITKSKFTFLPPTAEFNAHAGIGLMFGCDFIIDKLAGPGIAMGPKLTADAGLKIAPFSEKPVDFNASVDLGVVGEASAKLKIWKWDIAEWNTDLDFGLNKNLFKYPSDNPSEDVQKNVEEINKQGLLYYAATINQDKTKALKATGGTQQASKRDGYNGLFDTNSNTHWYVPSGYKQDGKCWYVDFQSGGIVKPIGFILTSGKDIKKHPKCNPKNWKLYGKKNKNDEWTVMYTADRATDGGVNSLPAENNFSKIYNISNPAEYQYFRLEITENWGDNALMLGGFAFAY